MIICLVALPLQDALHKQFGSKCEERQKKEFWLGSAKGYEVWGQFAGQ